MKAVVDTNVIAYYLLGNAEFDGEIRSFWQDVSDALGMGTVRPLVADEDVGHGGRMMLCGLSGVKIRSHG